MRISDWSSDVCSSDLPQIVAIVLAYLDPDQAAEILPLLPERMRSDVLMRIARLDGIQPQALRELDELMEKQFSGGSNPKSSSVGGVKFAANILIQIGRASCSARVCQYV